MKKKTTTKGIKPLAKKYFKLIKGGTSKTIITEDDLPG